MTARKILLVPVLILLLAERSSGDSRLSIDSDGGYQGFVIKIDKDVPEEQCPVLLANIENVLKAASLGLNKALDSRAYFKSATIVIPATWQGRSCARTILPPGNSVPYRRPDAFVKASEDPIHRDAPFTQQSRGCGQSGDFMVFTSKYFTAKNESREKWGDLSKVFLNEFAKYRYGIFDEFGFPNDNLYPNYFIHNGEILPTGTTNVNVRGMWISDRKKRNCDPTKETCHFIPTGKNDAVTCSLGYLPFLPNVNRWCDAESIKKRPLAPTKHNVLCGGKSAQEVILSHGDFSGVDLNRARAAHDILPSITVVQEPPTKYVLVIETSRSVDEKNTWKWINKAAQKFIRYDLPVNSNLAIITFNNISKVEHGMALVADNEVRSRLADAIPDTYHLSDSHERCVICAMRTLTNKIVQREAAAGTHVVLITTGGTESLPRGEADYNQFRRIVEGNNLKFSAVLLPAAASPALTVYDEVSRSTEGKTFVVRRDSNGMDFYVELTEALSEITRSDSVYPSEVTQVLHKKDFAGSGAMYSQGTFIVDSTLGRDTVFGVFVEDDEDHRIKSVSFTDSRGKSYGPFNRFARDFDIINFKTINFPTGKEPPFNDADLLGTSWQYSIEWHSGIKDSSSRSRELASVRKNFVVVTSKPRSRNENGLITVKTWNGVTQTRTGHDVVTVFASVALGGKPVVDAAVHAQVHVAFPNGSESIKLSAEKMNDDGFGDPDLVRGDGIYSLRLTRYPAAGRYEVTVTVDDNQGNAAVVSASSYPESRKMSLMAPCCGSNVVHTHSKEPTGVFRRTLVGNAVLVANVADEDTIAPSKIGDFSVRLLHDTRTLHAAWTSPDNDVVSYKMVFSEEIGILLQNDFPSVLHSFEPGKPAGIEKSISFELPENFHQFDRDLYVAIYGVDASSNRGKMSNFVYLRVPGMVLEDRQIGRTDFDEESTLTGISADLDWIVIGIIAGVVGVLLVLSVVAIVYYCVVARRGRRQSSGGKAGSTTSMMNGGGASSDETDSSSFDSDIKNIMANALGTSSAVKAASNGLKYHHQHPGIHQQAPHLHLQHSQLTAIIGGSSVDSGVSSNSSGDTPTQAAETPSGASVTPVYWSASQLLSKLDQQHQHQRANPYYHHGRYSSSSSSPQQQQHVVSAGPHSLQPHLRNGDSPNGPASLHNLSFGERFDFSEFKQNRMIPEEYTITVGDLEGTRGVCNSSNSNNSNNNKVPPPVMPKPRNITQV